MNNTGTKYVRIIKQTAFWREKNGEYIHSFISIQPWGRSGRNQSPVMEPMWLLAHCILGKFLGIVCHCFSPSLEVPTFATTCLCVLSNTRDPSSKRWNYGWERCPVVNLGIFTWDQRLYFPSEGRRAEDFFALKIRRLRPGLNPWTWVPKASTLPVDHRSRYRYYIRVK